MHDILTEIGERMENITGMLVIFVEVDVEALKVRQNRGTNNLVCCLCYDGHTPPLTCFQLHLTTIATFCRYGWLLHSLWKDTIEILVR